MVKSRYTCGFCLLWWWTPNKRFPLLWTDEIGFVFWKKTEDFAWQNLINRIFLDSLPSRHTVRLSPCRGEQDECRNRKDSSLFRQDCFSGLLDFWWQTSMCKARIRQSFLAFWSFLRLFRKWKATKFSSCLWSFFLWKYLSLLLMVSAMGKRPLSLPWEKKGVWIVFYLALKHH